MAKQLPIQLCLLDCNENETFIDVKSDGSINITQMLSLVRKKVSVYLNSPVTREFIHVLSKRLGSIADVVSTRKGRGNQTFVHRDLAIHCSFYCSSDFAIEMLEFYRSFDEIQKQINESKPPKYQIEIS